MKVEQGGEHKDHSIGELLPEPFRAHCTLTAYSKLCQGHKSRSGMNELISFCKDGNDS